MTDGHGIGAFHDNNDEIEAFVRGSFWGGESMPWRYYSHLSRDTRAISVGSSPAAVQQTANHFNIIIRFNGVTYYGRTK